MKRRFLIYMLVFVMSLFLVYSAHVHFFTFTSLFIKFLTDSYIYLATFTIIVCFALLFLQKKEKFKPQLGFLYLFTVPVKIILFIIFFEKQFFNQSFTSNKELFNVLIIIGLTLFFEVFFVSQILNDSETSKNVE